MTDVTINYLAVLARAAFKLPPNRAGGIGCHFGGVGVIRLTSQHEKYKLTEVRSTQYLVMEQTMNQLIQAWNAALISVAQQHKLDEHQPNTIPSNLERFTLEQFERRDVAPRFLVLTAPSGAGKGTVGKKLEDAGIRRLPRVNTRAPRPGEVEGVDYIFLSDDEYERQKAAGEILCPTEAIDKATGAIENKAGIPKQQLLEALSRGEQFYIDSGAGTARNIKTEAALHDIPFVLVFLLPPSLEEMARRARTRSAEERSQRSSKGTVTEDALMRRLERAVRHLADTAQSIDVYVVNDDVDRAARQIIKLFNY
ncbi:MAG: hypothetical protein WAP74_03475 [Patescibacteria group bacterium]